MWTKIIGGDVCIFDQIIVCENSERKIVIIF